ncbi:hypothetical protein [Dyadobacter aurulentus]|uniref:hypothetical protein n=1 Tax=Dyadobacter sp. UC 10 TaxID=2605428 RepID=UPI0011F36F12|nr:hypothetical protein [Dyadobacter sp. UC 10]KAA0989023.1 hypothetical protein FXO21_02005 [Dyadobacter sp. UC 10]
MQEPGEHSAKKNKTSPGQEGLARIVSEMETDDNMRKLAEKLFAEWKQPPATSESEPDLTFESFSEKIKERNAQ